MVHEHDPSPQYVRLTVRVFPDQREWVRQMLTTYRQRHPRVPKLTMDEFIRIAIEELRRHEEELDAIITRYRS
ncbi:hypothetical protein [Candidatus Entotheonella palauensis]|uniref:Uncharacterized protein n=1 Tax=Candidatus Entotheonella gemina TaxID=1429439 RepID=W4LJP2_9BACT|nr:hypothetical protein [Candidatus Entotheonella palauensis]ETW97571.1 MAG: hypothetical protein ETSY2_44410 [Candidatus Entotheonella gemina]